MYHTRQIDEAAANAELLGYSCSMLSGYGRNIMSFIVFRNLDLFEYLDTCRVPIR